MKLDYLKNIYNFAKLKLAGSKKGNRIDYIGDYRV